MRQYSRRDICQNFYPNAVFGSFTNRMSTSKNATINILILKSCLLPLAWCCYYWHAYDTTNNTLLQNAYCKAHLRLQDAIIFYPNKVLEGEEDGKDWQEHRLQQVLHLARGATWWGCLWGCWHELLLRTMIWSPVKYNKKSDQVFKSRKIYSFGTLDWG